ncbi:hypothetical protein ANCCAN_23802 [Ancylostoma caninum]|uniref:Uncharacterized protein n=1 Tax=Ancylostoma caninum TaxID=29170 RepID=A0A368FE22_ANCCA|nr:hypothetical protein ANCCAN_23802 [Ancylostoma caninum]
MSRVLVLGFLLFLSSLADRSFFEIFQ